MPASRWFITLAPLGAIFTVVANVNAAPFLHNINASGIGTGITRGLDWTEESVESPVWCGTACAYLQVSTAKIAPDTLFTYTPTTWPGAYFNSLPNLAAVSRLTLTPAGTTDSSGREIVHNSPHYERGSVDITRVGKSLNTTVYQSGDQGSSGTGTAAAAAAYHVHVQNQSSGGRDYFVRFTAPKATGGVSIPYNIGGPSGQQPIYVSQNKYAKSRSAVDVLVNGLPVWSTSSSYLMPQESTSSSDYSGFAIDFGYSSDNDFYTVFVGRFASGEIFDLDFIVRAESVARAPTCGKETESALYPNPRVLMHCFLITEGRDLPPATGQNAEFEIYSKVVSTPILIRLPGLVFASGLNSTQGQ